MGHALEVLILGLLLVTLFWKGVQSDTAKYEINVPNMVSVQEGLCISIPCNFSYDPYFANIGSPLYGYWYDYRDKKTLGDPVATNDKTKKIEDKTVGRFNLSPKVESGDCSLIINDAREEDEREYYFRMEKKPDPKFSYYNKATLKVEVTKVPNPVIEIPEKIQAGEPVNITCIALESCFLKRPHLVWEGLFDQVKSGIPATQSNSSMDRISLLSFIPSAENHGHGLTCRVTYGEGPSALYINETVLLNVTYPPQKLWISAEVLRSNQSLQNHTVASQLEIEKGVSVTLCCHVDGNPLPNVTWVKLLQPSGTPQPILDNKLSLLNVMAQDVGKYECRAQNSEGVTNVSFHLSIAPEGIWQQNVIHGLIGGFVVFGIITLIVGAVLVCKKWQKKRKPVTDMDSYAKQKTIQGKRPPDVKDSSSIGLNSVKGKDFPPAQEKMGEAIYEVPNELEDLHYASVTFNPLRPLPQAASEYSPTEYAEIKTS